MYYERECEFFLPEGNAKNRTVVRFRPFVKNQSESMKVGKGADWSRSRSGPRAGTSPHPPHRQNLRCLTQPPSRRPARSALDSTFRQEIYEKWGLPFDGTAYEKKLAAEVDLGKNYKSKQKYVNPTLEELGISEEVINSTYADYVKQMGL